MWVSAAVVAAGAIGAGAQAYSANQAGKAAQGAARNELELKQQQFDYQKQLNQPFYDKSLPALDSLVSGIRGTVDPNTGRTWTPQDSPALDWQRQQLDKNMGRRLRALGRENSTFGLNSMGDAYNNLYANEYDKQLGRLADLTNIARGGASSLSNISNQRVGAIGNYTEGMLAGDLIKQQGYNNAIQTGLSGINAAAGIYKQPKLSQPSISGMQPGNSYGVAQFNENAWNTPNWGR